MHDCLVSHNICRIVPGFRQVDGFGQPCLVKVWKDRRPPAVKAFATFTDRVRRRKAAIFVVVIVQCQTNLFQMILALRPACNGAGTACGRQQQSNQNEQDGRNSEHFEQCPFRASRRPRHVASLHRHFIRINIHICIDGTSFENCLPFPTPSVRAFTCLRGVEDE